MSSLQTKPLALAVALGLGLASLWQLACWQAVTETTATFDGINAATRSAFAQERPESTKPTAFRARGRLVCLAEEMKKLYGANVQPVHDHILGFRLDDESAEAAGVRYYTLLRTDQSEALYVDGRFGDQLLLLAGRVFPDSAILEVSGWQWYRGDELYDVYYWCEVCSIRGVDPGSCACCQADVELRERSATSKNRASKNAGSRAVPLKK